MSRMLTYTTLILILLCTTFGGCIRAIDKEYGGKADILSIGAHKPKLLDKVIYSYDGQNYAISPKEKGNKIAAVKTRVVNLRSTQVTLSVDEKAAYLETKDGTAIYGFNPIAAALETTDMPEDANPYGVHLWGNFQLQKGYEIAGWLFFELPSQDWTFTGLIWEDVEYVKVYYPE